MKKKKFKNVAIVSNIDGLISIFCDHEKMGSRYYHEYFFLDNDLNVKAHFASKGCLHVEQLYEENDQIFSVSEYLFDKKGRGKEKIVKVNPDLSYEVLHEIDWYEAGIEDGAFAIKKNGLYGFMDANGVEFIKPQYEEYTSFSYGLAGVYKDGKLGFINKKNELVIPYEYEFPENECRLWNEYQNKLYISVMKNGKWGIIDSSNNVVIPFEYEDIGGADNLIFAQLNGKVGFIDMNNNVVVPYIYENPEYLGYSTHVYCENSDYIAICQNGLFGLLDRNAQIIIPFEYKKIFADENLIVAKKQNNKYVLLDYKNTELSEEFDNISDFGAEGFYVAEKDKHYCYINSQGKRITPLKYSKHSWRFNGGLAVAEYYDYEKGADVINTKGKVLYHAKKFREVFNAGNGYILAKNGNGEFEFVKLF